MFWGEFRVWLILFTMRGLTLALLISIFICLKLKFPRQFLSLNDKKNVYLYTCKEKLISHKF